MFTENKQKQQIEKLQNYFFFSFKKMKIGIERKSNDELCWYTYESNRRMWTDGRTDGWMDMIHISKRGLDGQLHNWNAKQ